LESSDRGRILAEGETRAWERLAGEILSCARVRIIRPPAASLVMMRARDPVEGIVFNPGEVLITECEVEMDQARGWGCIMGDEPAKALAAAIIDAALNNGHHLKDKILEELRLQEEKINSLLQLEYKLAGRTRVDFETMEGPR